MTMATGRLHKSVEECDEANYSSLLGFVPPPVRIDPHTHNAEESPQVNLRDVAETIRQRSAAAG